MEFRDLLELYKSGKYEEVINSADAIEDFNAKFLLLRSEIALNKYDDALKTYIQNRELLEKHNLIEAIKVYLFLLVQIDAPSDLMKKEIDYFKDKNYVNQETEEFLCELDEYVNTLKKENSSEQKLTIEKVIEMLKSTDESDVFSALTIIINDSQYKSLNLLPTIENILKERSVMDLPYAMLLDFLVSNSYDGNLFFKKENSYFKMNPKDFTYKNMEQAKLIHQALNHIQSNEKNISVGDFVLKVIIRSSYMLAPNYLTNLKEISSYIVAIYLLAGDAFKIGFEGDKVYEFYYELADKNLIDSYRIFLKKNAK